MISVIRLKIGKLKTRDPQSFSAQKRRRLSYLSGNPLPHKNNALLFIERNNFI